MSGERTMIGTRSLVGSALAIGAALALALAPAAHADHSITVSSSAGGVSSVGSGYYRVSFNTSASSSEPCRNWADAADAHVTHDGETSQTAPVESSSTADPTNANESAVSFGSVYEVPADSRVTFTSRVGCDTVNHIGGEGFGSPVEAETPPDEDTCEGTQNRIESVQTASGDDLGLSGTQLYDGQTIKARERTRIRLGDTSVVTLSKGDSYDVHCEDFTLIDVFVNTLIKISSGSDAKFRVETPRAVTGVRGTEISVEYEKKKERTTVNVKSGKVEVQAKRGSKKKVVAGKGETVVQVGKKAPKIVKK